MARALLLHFATHWPAQASTSLWPFAVDQAIHIWNRIPRQDGKTSPLEHFSGMQSVNHHGLQRPHVFGFPVCVLKPRLQDGQKVPKWERRSCRGVCPGVSRLHSTTVHLVLNPDTGKISSQHHCVFDDKFSTVFTDGHFANDVWNSLELSNHECHHDDVSSSSVQQAELPISPGDDHPIPSPMPLERERHPCSSDFNFDFNPTRSVT